MVIVLEVAGFQSDHIEMVRDLCMRKTGSSGEAL